MHNGPIISSTKANLTSKVLIFPLFYENVIGKLLNDYINNTPYIITTKKIALYLYDVRSDIFEQCVLINNHNCIFIEISTSYLFINDEYEKEKEIKDKFNILMDKIKNSGYYIMDYYSSSKTHMIVLDATFMQSYFNSFLISKYSELAKTVPKNLFFVNQNVQTTVNLIVACIHKNATYAREHLLKEFIQKFSLDFSENEIFKMIDDYIKTKDEYILPINLKHEGRLPTEYKDLDRLEGIVNFLKNVSKEIIK